MSDHEPFPYIGIAPYGGSLRSVSLAISDGRGRMMHQHLTPEECEALALTLVKAAATARQDEVVPESMSMRPGDVAALTMDGERVAA